MAVYLLRWSLVFNVLLVQIYLTTGEKGSNQSSWSRLRSDLLDHEYDVTEIPSIEDGIPLPVTVHLTLQAIREVNEKEQSVIGTSTLNVVWEDDRLMWNPRNYCNLTVLTLPYRMVWTPSLNLLNTNFEISRIPPAPDDTKVHISNNGQVTLETSFRHSTGCPMNLTLFPFDNQSCTMLITSQDLVTTNVELVPGNITHRVKDRHPSWDLVSVDAESRSRLNQAGNHNISDLLVSMKLNRLPNHYIFTIIIPVMLINALGIWSFFIPLKSGERVSTCISVVLGVTVFQIVITEVMPETSRSGATPHTIKYLTMTFVTLVAIMLCSVVTLNICYQTRRIKGKILRILFFQILATMVFKRQEGLRKTTDRKIDSEKSDAKVSDRTIDYSMRGETHSKAPAVARNVEVTDMELVATIFDRVFFSTFIVVEIWMIFLLKATFSVGSQTEP